MGSMLQEEPWRLEGDPDCSNLITYMTSV